MRHIDFLRAPSILAAALVLSSIAFGGLARAQGALPDAPAEPGAPATEPATLPAPAPLPAPTPPPPPSTTPGAGGYAYPAPVGQPRGPFEDPPMAPSPKAVQYRWSFEANARTLRFKNSGYEAFTTGETLSTASLGAYYGFLSQGPLSLHVGAQWNVGGIEGTARAQATTLTVHQFGLGLLGRFRVNRWLFPAIRVVPLAQYTSASIRPDESPSRFDSKGFAFGADATAGVHLVPFTIGDVDWPKLRIWIFLEGGISLVTKREMKLEAHQADDDPRRLEDIRLRDLSTTGYLSRLGVAVSF